MSGMDEISSRKGGVSLGTLSPDPWDFFRFDAIPVVNLSLGSSFEPQLGLAPESALRLPPGRALSSAPAVVVYLYETLVAMAERENKT
jgi:hypothetical protein